jgi:hypothetical protein
MTPKMMVGSTLICCFGLLVSGASADAVGGTETEVARTEQPAAERPAEPGQHDSDPESQALEERLEQLAKRKEALEEELRKLTLREALLPALPIAVDIPVGSAASLDRKPSALGSFAGAGIGGWHVRSKGIDAAKTSAKRGGRAEYAHDRANDRRRLF